MFICGSPWGIGLYIFIDPNTKEEFSGYGFPMRDMDPNDFTPDYECCTKEEIAAWEKAKREWKSSETKLLSPENPIDAGDVSITANMGKR